MGTTRIEDLLKDLGERGIERPRPELAREMRGRIPNRLICHRIDTINIIVDLRISRMAAAAAIILVLLVVGAFWGRRDAAGKRFFEDGKLFLQYTLGGENACSAQAVEKLARFRDDLVAQGRDVVFYGDQADLSDRYAIIMYWKCADDKYGVVLGDLSARTVSANALIRLHTHMLQERGR